MECYGLFISSNGHLKFSWKLLLPSRISTGPTYTGRIGCQWADNQRAQITATRGISKVPLGVGHCYNKEGITDSR
jgi:hypothetical protein